MVSIHTKSLVNPVFDDMDWQEQHLPLQNMTINQKSHQLHLYIQCKAMVMAKVSMPGLLGIYTLVYLANPISYLLCHDHFFLNFIYLNKLTQNYCLLLKLFLVLQLDMILYYNIVVQASLSALKNEIIELFEDISDTYFISDLDLTLKFFHS